MLGRLKETFEAVASPIAKALPRRPNLLTLLSLVIAAATIPMVLFLPHELLFIVIALYAASAFLDMADGIVARRYGLTSRLGSFLDSVCDRYVDSIMLLNLALLCREQIVQLLVIVSLIGSYMTSYCRAKAESLEIKMLGIGTFERAERVLFLIAVYTIYYLLSSTAVIIVLLTLFAAVVNATAIERIVRCVMVLRRQGGTLQSTS